MSYLTLHIVVWWVLGVVIFAMLTDGNSRLYRLGCLCLIAGWAATFSFYLSSATLLSLPVLVKLFLAFGVITAPFGGVIIADKDIVTHSSVYLGADDNR